MTVSVSMAALGKSFAYGAQDGILLVQGNADSRACVRLSGARVVIGGEITIPVDDSVCQLGSRANIKGFACEYMTSGTVIILGDPGPYAFSGMTGGIVYQMMNPEMGFDLAALRRRLAKGASVSIDPSGEMDVQPVQQLLEHYIAAALEQTYQVDTAERVRRMRQPEFILKRFVKITRRFDNH